MLRLLRACLMIVGPGRAGKSSLVNSLGDKPFKHTDSTAGVATSTVDTTDMHNWQEMGVSEFEQVIARTSLCRREHGNLRGMTNASVYACTVCCTGSV